MGMKCVCACECACAVGTILFFKWLKLPLLFDLCSHPWGLFLELISTPTDKQDKQGQRKEGHL